MRRWAWLLLIPFSAQALTLDEYLNEVRAKNGMVRSFQDSKEAAQSRRVQGNLELSPILQMRAAKVTDKKLQVQGTSVVNQLDSSDYTLSLAKKFSTGTQAAISLGVNDLSINGTNIGVTPSQALNQSFSTGYLGLSLSQSLWKDFFGNGVRLRQEREGRIEATELQGLNLQERQTLIEAESAFWDHLYLKEELDQRKQSLERAKKIEGWVKNRASNGIGDKADVYNSQGLVALRELQLLASQDEFKASEVRLRNVLELKGDEKLPDIKGDISKERKLGEFVSGDAAGRVVRMDAYLSVLESDVKSIVAREVEDGMRPDLVLEGSYKTNSFENDPNSALNKVSDQSRPTTAVALRFSYPLDWGVTGAAKNAARMEAKAAELRRDRKLLESDSSWSEFTRRHDEMGRKIKAATLASRLQTLKSNAERDKLSKGRSVTSQVVIAEQDAAESLLTLTRFQVEQRKMEAQAQLFFRMKENQ